MILSRIILDDASVTSVFSKNVESAIGFPVVAAANRYTRNENVHLANVVGSKITVDTIVDGDVFALAKLDVEFRGITSPILDVNLLYDHDTYRIIANACYEDNKTALLVGIFRATRELVKTENVRRNILVSLDSKSAAILHSSCPKIERRLNEFELYPAESETNYWLAR